MSVLDIKMQLIMKLRKLRKKPKFKKFWCKKYTFKDLNYAIVRNYDELIEFAKKNKKTANFCHELNRQNLEEGLKEGELDGYCCLCNKKTKLGWKIRPLYSNNILFTEVLWHKKCHMFNRQRAMIHLFKIFEKSMPKNKTIYLYEQTTLFYEHFKNLWGDDNEIIGSEYMGWDKTPGEIINGIRHEDSINLSFKDNSLDYMISNDVFEHVPDIEKTLSEAKRCLKSGGKLMIRMPVEWNREKTFKRAEFKDGKIEYLAEKVFHGGFQHDGNDGSLLVYNYGRDVFDIIKKAGFKDAYGVAIMDEKYGYISYDPITIFICEK